MNKNLLYAKMCVIHACLVEESVDTFRVSSLTAPESETAECLRAAAGSSLMAAHV